MKKKILLFILMTLLRCVQAQPAADSITEKKIKVEMLTVEDGLSQGNITSIVQDKNGFMWFGTKDGLNKYDGYNFTVYVHDEKKPYSIAKNHITNLLADKRGFLWVFYLDGSIDVFNPETDKAYHIQNTLLKNEVSWQHAFLDANENLFLYSGHGFLKVTLIGKPEFAESDFKLKVVELTDFLPKKINDTNRVYFFIS